MDSYYLWRTYQCHVFFHLHSFTTIEPESFNSDPTHCCNHHKSGNWRLQMVLYQQHSIFDISLHLQNKWKFYYQISVLRHKLVKYVLVLCLLPFHSFTTIKPESSNSDPTHCCNHHKSGNWRLCLVLYQQHSIFDISLRLQNKWKLYQVSVLRHN